MVNMSKIAPAITMGLGLKQGKPGEMVSMPTGTVPSSPRPQSLIKPVTTTVSSVDFFGIPHNYTAVISPATTVTIPATHHQAVIATNAEISNGSAVLKTSTADCAIATNLAQVNPVCDPRNSNAYTTSISIPAQTVVRPPSTSIGGIVTTQVSAAKRRRNILGHPI